MGCVPSMQVSHTDISKRDFNATTTAPSTHTHHQHQLPSADDGCSRCVRSMEGPETTMDSYVVNALEQAPRKDVVPGANSLGFSEEKTDNRQNGGKTGCFGSNREAFFGPLKIQQQALSVLLVFPKKDAQCEAFLRAAETSKYTCHLSRSVDGAVKSYDEHHHDVVVVDTRDTKDSDPEILCRQIRATHNSEYTVMVAVRPLKPEKEDWSMLSLLKAGFSRQFVENASAGACLSELQCLEFGEVLAQAKLKAAQALILAVEHCNDAVEITNENHEIQYVNATFEKLFGYTGDEIIGKNFQDISKSDGTKYDIVEAINNQLKKGNSWDGTYNVRLKTGENFAQKCRVYPVLGQSGKICHYVGIRNSVNDGMTDHTNGWISRSTVSESFRRKVRKESASRLPSMSIEAPITKAINMISSIQETCPPSIVDPLDKVLEVLRSNELYSPYFTQQVRDDKMTNDLVGGLMKIDDEWSHKKAAVGKRLSCSSETTYLTRTYSYMSGLTTSKTSADIQLLLDTEEKWDFDIIQLERLTENRPLVHLAMRTFQRFDVLQFLKVDENLMYAWLQMIESKYHAHNPYHNSTHAADVMHAASFYLTCDIIKNTFDQMDEVSCLLAAVIHDLDHPGKTSSFLVNSNAELAILYNDVAVLESHHVSLAYSLTLKNESLNIFKNLIRDDYRSLRQQIVDMVLATEMTKHFEHLNRFISVVNQPSPEENTDVTNSQRILLEESIRLSTAENRTLVKRILIKCADVSNPARPLTLCIEWAKRIASEYCQQTDDERAQGLPVVMPIFDSKTCNMPTSQIRFIELFINDMFETWSNFCDLPVMKTYITDNYQYWKEQEAVVAEQLEQKKDQTSSRKKEDNL